MRRVVGSRRAAALNSRPHQGPRPGGVAGLIGPVCEDPQFFHRWHGMGWQTQIIGQIARDWFGEVAAGSAKFGTIHGVPAAESVLATAL